MKLLNAEISNRRQKLGWDELRLASLLSMTIDSYADLEQHSDEWKTVTEFYKIRFLCSLLIIDLIDFVPVTNGLQLTKQEIPSIVLSRRRIELGLRAEDFADRVGFDPAFTVICENLPDGLLLYPFGAIESVCSTLQIELQSFTKTTLLACA